MDINDFETLAGNRMHGYPRDPMGVISQEPVLDTMHLLRAYHSGIFERSLDSHENHHARLTIAQTCALCRALPYGADSSDRLLAVSVFLGSRESPMYHLSEQQQG